MITKLRAAFTRAKVNHPRKLIFGTPNAVAAMLIPFDGGASFLMTSALTGGWQIPSILITGGVALLNVEKAGVEESTSP